MVIFHLWDLPSKPLMVALTKMKRVQECTLLLSLASLRGKRVCCDSSVFPNLLCCDQSTSWLLEFSLLVRFRRLELSCRFVVCESTQGLVVFQGLNTLEGFFRPDSHLPRDDTTSPSSARFYCLRRSDHKSDLTPWNVPIIGPHSLLDM